VDSRLTISRVVQAFVLGLRFVTELALVAGAAWAASSRTESVLVAVVLGVAAALAVALVWAVAIAPTARRRLRDPVRLVLEIVLFVAVGGGIAAVGYSAAAAVLVLVGAATAVGVRFVGPTREPRSASDEATDAAMKRPRGRERGRRTR
jgi:hypothetical protein